MQRKATPQSRGPNAQEDRFRGFVKSYPRCIACHYPGLVIAHHCEGATFKRKVDYVTEILGHFFIIPLCQRCDDIVTNESRKAFRNEFGPQRELWRKLVEDSLPSFGEEIPERIYKGIMESGC